MVTNGRYTGKHVPSNEIVLVTLKKKWKGSSIQRIFNYVSGVEMERKILQPVLSVV